LHYYEGALKGQKPLKLLKNKEKERYQYRLLQVILIFR